MDTVSLCFAGVGVASFCAMVYYLVVSSTPFGQKIQVWLPALLTALVSVVAFGILLRLMLGLEAFHSFVYAVLGGRRYYYYTSGLEDYVYRLFYASLFLSLLLFGALLPMFAKRAKRKSDAAITDEIAKWKSQQEKINDANSGRGV